MRLLSCRWPWLDALSCVLLLLLLLVLTSPPAADAASLDGAYAQMRLREAFGESRTIRHSKGLMTQQQPKPAPAPHSLLPTAAAALAESARAVGSGGLLSADAAASASAITYEEGAVPAAAPETVGRLAAAAEPVAAAVAAGTSDKAAATAAAGSSLLSLLQHQQRPQQQPRGSAAATAASERRGRTQLGAQLSQARNATRSGGGASDSRSRFATVYTSQNAERPVFACEKGHVACPTPNRKNLVQCIAVEALCNSSVDCYGGEDEDPVMCMFYKQIYLDLDARIAHINDHLKELYRYVNEHTHDAEGHTVVLTEFPAKGG